LKFAKFVVDYDFDVADAFIDQNIKEIIATIDIDYKNIF
jgi:hypothetical protein